MNLNRKNIQKIMFLIAFTLILAMCLFNIGTVMKYVNIFLSVLTPFFIGAAIAFVVNIPMRGIENKFFGNPKIKRFKFTQKIARPFSLLLALIFIIGIIAVVVGVVIPDLYKTIVSLSKNITDFLPKLLDFVRTYINNDAVESYIKDLQHMDWLNMLNDVMGVFTVGAGNVINTTLDVVSVFMSATYNILIAFVFCIYILLQKEYIFRIIRKILKAFASKRVYTEIIRVAKLTNNTFSSYVSGQCLDAFILGVIFFVVLMIAGMPYPLLISVLVGFTALIPIIGAFIGCIISMLLIFMVNPTLSIIFLIIFLIIQQIDGNLIYPRVVGGSVGLSPIWVLVAVIIGGNLFGIIGMILFIPLLSVIYRLFSEYVEFRISKKTDFD